MKKLMQTLCLALFAGILAACGGDDSAEKTTETFFKELFSGDANKAAELIYLPQEMSDKDVETAKGKITIMAGEMQAQIKKEGNIDVSVDEVEATVKVTLTGKKNGKEHSETNNVRLIKTDKGWRIKM